MLETFSSFRMLPATILEKIYTVLCKHAHCGVISCTFNPDCVRLYPQMGPTDWRFQKLTQYILKKRRAFVQNGVDTKNFQNI